MRQITILLIVLTGVCLACCNQPEAPGGLFDLELQFYTEMLAGVKTLVPDISLEITLLSVTGDGPGTEYFEISTSESICTVERIIAGSWSISVEGFNPDGAAVLFGETNEELSPDNNKATVHLFPLPGVGSLNLDISWDAQSTINPLLSVSIEDGIGTFLVPDVQQSSGAGMVRQELEAGYYSVVLQLYDGDALVGGRAEAVCIVADQITSASIALDVQKESLNAEIFLDISPYLPLAPLVVGPLPPVFTGTAYGVSVVLQEEVERIDWYQNGHKVGNGPVFDFESVTAGRFRIDALTFGSDFSFGGSDYIVLEAVVPIYYGSLLFIRAYQNSDPDIDGISGARQVVAGNDGQFVAVAGYSSDKIAILKSDAQTGDLVFQQGISNSADVPLDGVRALAITDDDRYLFAASYGSNGVAWFERAADDGNYSFVGFTGLESACDVTVAGNGQLLIAVARDTSRIVTYRINAVLAHLELLSSVEGAEVPDGKLSAPEHVFITPDGQQAVVSCWNSDTILIFEMDDTTGSLELRQAFTDGVDGIEGLNGPGGCAFSGDGRHMYVAGYYDHAVSLFTWDQTASRWIWSKSWTDGSDSVQGIRYARDVALSADEAEVYVCGGGSDALSVFARDSGTGELSFLGCAADGEDRVAGLDGVRSVCVSANGRNVYTASSNDSAVALFRSN